MMIAMMMPTTRTNDDYHGDDDDDDEDSKGVQHMDRGVRGERMQIVIMMTRWQWRHIEYFFHVRYPALRPVSLDGRPRKATDGATPHGSARARRRLATPLGCLRADQRSKAPRARFDAARRLPTHGKLLRTRSAEVGGSESLSQKNSAPSGQATVASWCLHMTARA